MEQCNWDIYPSADAVLSRLFMIVSGTTERQGGVTGATGGDQVPEVINSENELRAKT